MGYKEPVTVWDADGKRVEVLDLLPTDGQQQVDLPLSLGASKQVKARLIAKQMPEALVKRQWEQRKRTSV